MTRKKKVVKTDMQTYLDIFRLKFDAKLSDRQTAQALNIGRSTVSNLLFRFVKSGIGWPIPDDYPLEELDKQLLPRRDYASSRVMPDWVKLHVELTNKSVTK